MFPMHGGIVSDKLLFERMRYLRDVRLQMEDGSSPFNPLEERNNKYMFDRFAMLVGIGPGIEIMCL